MDSKLKLRLSLALDAKNVEINFLSNVMVLSDVMHGLRDKEEDKKSCMKDVMLSVMDLPFLWAPYAEAARDVLANWEFAEGNRARTFLNEVASTAPIWKDTWGKKPNMWLADEVLKNLSALKKESEMIQQEAATGFTVPVNVPVKKEPEIH